MINQTFVTLVSMSEKMDAIQGALSTCLHQGHPSFCSHVSLMTLFNALTIVRLTLSPQLLKSTIKLPIVSPHSSSRPKRVNHPRHKSYD